MGVRPDHDEPNHTGYQPPMGKAAASGLAVSILAVSAFVIGLIRSDADEPFSLVFPIAAGAVIGFSIVAVSMVWLTRRSRAGRLPGRGVPAWAFPIGIGGVVLALSAPPAVQVAVVVACAIIVSSLILVANVW